ncbi:MAG: hypothetical protein BGO41_13235 [Clostridiales bacterium 38-18]|nr:MAG: hypothetical protein BGO41_13235 [Clostridiales bacterium 38-18]
MMKKNKFGKYNLSLFFMGKGVSVIGSSIYNFAVGLYVLKLTGSALNYGITLMLSILPLILISPFGGVIADRFNKKIIVVSMDIINGLLFIAIYLLTEKMNFSLGLVYLTTILLNSFGTLFAISIEAAKPNLVKEDRLIKINAYSKLIDSISSVLGPIVGGIIYALFDIRAFVLFNGISFLISALSESFMDFNYYTKESHVKINTSFRNDFKEGIHYFFKNKAIVEYFFIFATLNFLLGFSVNVPAPYLINEVFKLSSAQFGLINGLFPVGLIIGSLTIESLLKKFTYKKVLLSMNLFLAILAGMIGLPYQVLTSSVQLTIFYGLNFCLMGLAIAYVDVPITTLLQQEVPSHLLGRVMSILMSLVKVVLPIALVVSGAAISVMPIKLIPIIGALASAGFTLYLMNKEHQLNKLNFENIE